jgi:hypothetical protein
MTKYLIFDSGALINLTQNGLLDIFRSLEKVFQGAFIITPAVEYETINHPIGIKRFEWGALRIRQLLDDELIKRIEDEDLVDIEELNKKTAEIMNLANNSLFSENKPIHLIEKGESECLAVSILLSRKGVDNAVIIDERTARMICENPEFQRQLMENKLHTKIKLKKENLSILSGIKVLRSTELMYMAYKKNIMEKNVKELEAILYALKYGGCSVSEKEVEFMKKI